MPLPPPVDRAPDAEDTMIKLNGMKHPVRMRSDWAAAPAGVGESQSARRMPLGHNRKALGWLLIIPPEFPESNMVPAPYNAAC